MTEAKYSTILRKVQECSDYEDSLSFVDQAHHCLELARPSFDKLLKHPDVTKVETTASALGYSAMTFLKLSLELLKANKSIYLEDADLNIGIEHRGLIELLLNYQKVIFSRLIQEKQATKKLLKVSAGLMGRPGHDPSVVEHVKELRSEGLSYSEISYRLEDVGFKVSRSAICRILKKVSDEK